MKTVGILGGVGPETTANFYLYVIAECQRLLGQNRPDILINSLPISYSVEEDALLHGRNVEQFLPYLVDHAKRLEKSGCDFIVMPCNTLHRFQEEIQDSINVPFVSIIDVTEQFLRPFKKQRIGLIATGITLESEFYQNRFSQLGIECITPNDFQKVKIAKMIHGLVTGKYANNQRQVLIDIIDEFAAQSVSQTLLACTDLQALIPHHSSMNIVDTMQLLADAVIQEIHREE